MSEFEGKRYRNNIIECTEEAASFLGELAFSVLSSDRDLLIGVLEDLLLVNESKDGRFFPPSINYDSLLVKGDPDALIRRFKLPDTDKVYKSKGQYNDQLLGLLDYQLDSCDSNEKQQEFLHEVIALRTDAACRIKLFTNAYSINRRVPGYMGKMKKYCGKGYIKNYESCLDIRKLYMGHFQPYQYEDLTADKYCSTLVTIAKTINGMPDVPSNNKLAEKKKILLDTIDSLIEESKNAPISNERLMDAYAEYEYSEEYLLSSELKSDYDEDKKILFWHTIEEVEGIIKDKYETKKTGEMLLESRQENAVLSQENIEIKNWMQLAPLSAKKMFSEWSVEDPDNDSQDAEHQYATTATGKSRMIQHARCDLLATVFPAMNSLLKNNERLSDTHLKELADKATVIATADFWINDKGRSFLAREMAPILSSFDRKLLVDWSTRVELYKAETNAGNTYKEDEIRVAKTAHNVMHMMAIKKYALYLPTIADLYSSDQGVINLAMEHPESIFCVFTNSSSFVESAVKDGVNNVIPISILPTGQLTIRVSAKPLVEMCFSSDDEIEDSSENESEEVDSVTNEDRIVCSEKPAGDYPINNSEGEFIRNEIIKIDDGKQIEITMIPKRNDTVYSSDHKPVQLLEKLGEGGEGSIYSTDREHKVAKIYKKNKLTEMRKNKLEEMVLSGVRIRKLCLPETLLYTEEGVFVGYLMGDATGYMEMGCSVLKLKSESVSKDIMAGWDRLALVELCLDICQTFKNMQNRGLLMGDINPCNIMVNPRSESHTDYVFVDCDSYQFNGYPCPVGTMIFTSPKIYERNNLDANRIDFGQILRTLEDENYAISSLLFHILMLNESPFAGKGAANMEQAIRNYNFSYRLPGDEENTGAETPDGDGRLIWNNTPRNIRIMFGRVFKHREDVSIDDWIRELIDYKRNLERGVYTRELKPKNYWDTKDNQFTTYFTCAACGEYRNEPKQRYESEEEYNLPHLCAQCTQLKFSMKSKVEKVQCVRCGREYEENRWNIWLADNGYRKLTCPNCRAKVLVICARCGKEFQLPRYKYEYEVNVMKRMPWCQECKEDASNGFV